MSSTRNDWLLLPYANAKLRHRAGLDHFGRRLSYLALNTRQDVVYNESMTTYYDEPPPYSYSVAIEPFKRRKWRPLRFAEKLLRGIFKVVSEPFSPMEQVATTAHKHLYGSSLTVEDMRIVCVIRVRETIRM